MPQTFFEEEDKARDEKAVTVSDTPTHTQKLHDTAKLSPPRYLAHPYAQ